MIDGRGEKLQQLGATTNCATGQPAGHHLAEYGQVGRDSDHRLHPARREAEAGHHLVEHQERAGGAAQPPCRADEVGIERHATEVAARHLEDERRDTAIFERCLERREYGRVDDTGVVAKGFRYARSRHRLAAGIDADADCVVPTVKVVAQHCDDIAPSGGAGDAQRKHRPLRAR